MNLFLHGLRCIPVTLVMGILFFLSSQSGSTLQLPQIIGLDKVLHGIAYAVLGAAALFAVPPETRRRRAQLVSFGVVFFCMLYGISDEYHQSFVPGRMPSVADLLADTFGAMLMVFLWLRLSATAKERTA